MQDMNLVKVTRGRIMNKLYSSALGWSKRGCPEVFNGLNGLLFVWLSACLYLCVFVCLCLCVCLSVCQFIWLSICLSVSYHMCLCMLQRIRVSSSCIDYSLDEKAVAGLMSVCPTQFCPTETVVSKVLKTRYVFTFRRNIKDMCGKLG